jgi:glycerol-3-phosphate acyltransferase PlsY
MIYNLYGCKICGKIFPLADIRKCGDDPCGVTSVGRYLVVESLGITSIINDTFKRYAQRT